MDRNHVCGGLDSALVSNNIPPLDTRAMDGVGINSVHTNISCHKANSSTKIIPALDTRAMDGEGIECQYEYFSPHTE